MGSFVMGGPPKPKTVVIPGQKYPEACVWQPTSYLLVIWEFFVEYTFIGIWVHAHGMAALADARRGLYRAQRMDYEGFLERSRRLLWDIGGGGKSRPGYHGEEQWASILKAARAGDDFAKKLIAFLEKLKTAVSGACGFAVKPRSAMAIKYDHTGGSACDAVWPETTSLELVVSEGVEGLLTSVKTTVHRTHFVQQSRKTNCVLFDPSRHAQVALRHPGG